MLIKSFIVHTDTDQKSHVISELDGIDCCEVVPSQNTSLLVLALESQDSDEEKKIISKIEGIPGVQQLTMVFGAAT